MRVLAILLVMASANGAVLAQTNTPEVRKFSLEDCLKIALEHNLDVQVSRYAPVLSSYDLSSAKWAYDPQFSISGGHTFRQSPGGIDDTTKLAIPPSEGDGNFLSTDVKGGIPWGPTYRIGADFRDNYGFSSYYVGTNLVRRPIEDVNGSLDVLQLSQPLLKDFWIDNTRLQIIVQRKNLKISELQVRDQIMKTMTAVEKDYYDLIYAQENVLVQQAALKLAERLLEENRKRVEVGAMAPLDEKQAESQAAGSRADLLGAMGAEDTQQRKLKNLLSDDYSKWKDVSIQPTEKLVAMPERFDLQESWRKGLSQRPDLLQAKINLEKQGYQVKFAKNQIFPELNVVGTAGWSGRSDRNFDTVMDQVGGRDNPYWSISGQLNFPIFNRVAKNTYRAEKARGEQMTLQFKQLQQGILILIEDDIAVARTAFLRAQATREARIYANDALQAEEKKLASGKSTSFEVLRLQRDLTSASSAEIRALADYNIALAQVALDEGSTLERRRVSIEAK